LGTQPSNALFDLAKFQHPLESITSAHSSTLHGGSICEDKDSARVGKTRIKGVSRKYILRTTDSDTSISVSDASIHSFEE
jgi:hypothetical protein